MGLSVPVLPKPSQCISLHQMRAKCLSLTANRWRCLILFHFESVMLQQVSVFGDQREEKKKKPSARDTPFLGLVCQVCVTPKWTFNRTGQQFVSIYKIPFTLFSITITIHPPKTNVSTIIVLKTKHFFLFKNWSGSLAFDKEKYLCFRDFFPNKCQWW